VKVEGEGEEEGANGDVAKVEEVEKLVEQLQVSDAEPVEEKVEAAVAGPVGEE
jgi:hypothetical protein